MQKGELIFLGKKIPWSVQKLTSIYEDIAGALYTLEGRAGMSKGQFQQFMLTLQVPLPKAGPISSPLNDRIFAVFSIRKGGKVNLEDIIHVFSVYTSNNLDEKLKLSFKAFDMNHTGRISYTEMQNTLKVVCGVVYPGEKYELLHVFVSEVMAQYNVGNDGEHSLTLEQFLQVAKLSPKITHLFALGSVDQPQSSGGGSAIGGEEEPEKKPAAPQQRPPLSTSGEKNVGGRGSGEQPIRKTSAERQPQPQQEPTRKASVEKQPQSQQQQPSGDLGSGGRGRGRGGPDAGGGRGRGSGEAGGGGRGVKPRPNEPSEGGEGRGRGIARGDSTSGGGRGKEPQGGRGKGPTPTQQPNTAPTGGGRGGPVRKPTPPAKKEKSSDEEEEEETVEEANERLVAHVRALQVELRKYMKFDEENKAKIAELMEAGSALKQENKELLEDLQKANENNVKLREALKKEQKAKVHYKKIAKDKAAASAPSTAQPDVQRKRASSNSGDKMLIEQLQKENQQLMGMSLGYNSMLQYMVGPRDIPHKQYVPMRDTRVAKVGYMVKRGDLVKSWKRRLFLLRENMQLIYYAVGDRPDPKGIVDLKDAVLAREAQSPENAIEVITKSRSWVLACDSSEEVQDWLRILNTLIETHKLSTPRSL